MKNIALFVALAATVAACTTTPATSIEPYPFDVCLVSENTLGSMGDPITMVYEGREISFCCSPCVDEFEMDPAAFLGKLDR